MFSIHFSKYLDCWLNSIIHLNTIYTVILIDAQWKIIVALFCIYLMSNETEYLFISLYAFCISFMVTCLLISLTHLQKIRLFALLLLNFELFFCISRYRSYIRYVCFQIFCPTLWIGKNFLEYLLKRKSFIIL